MQIQQHYSPSNPYPTYVGWQVVIGRPASAYQALHRKQIVIPTPVHHR